MSSMTTKQVYKISIGEGLFHEIIEEHMPVLVHKQAAQLNDFFDKMIQYIESHTSSSDWFYMSNKDVLYHNAVVALFPDFNSYDLGHCPLNHNYDPVSFRNEFAGYTGSLMTIPEYQKAFAGKFDKLLEICPEFFLDDYFTVVDFRRAYHADGIRTKRWNGFSKAESYHIPIFRLNGMDSESISATKTLYFWLEQELIPDDLPAELIPVYRHTLTMYRTNKDCFEWKNGTIRVKEDIVFQAVLKGESELISDESTDSSFLYDANQKTITLDHLTPEAGQVLKKHLLESDLLRADFDAYDSNILTDPNRGHWGLWPDEYIAGKYTAALDEPYVARNPVADINENGVIGIDFGTKSTVVVYQDKTEHVIPMRIGTGHLSKRAERKQYENPTVMEFINLEHFMECYRAKEGRPETLWEDLTVSHSAVSSMMNSTSRDYYTFFNELKQWAGSHREQIRLKDKEGHDILLPPFMELSDGDFNPIEIYAYYIGLYINNMNNGIYLDYILSFPVTYEQKVCDKIIDSFYRGLKKSLPASVLNHQEAMQKFRVTKGPSEPASYAICALEEYGFHLDQDTDDVYYGIFDFGGGTTDYDFGHWYLPEEREQRKYDYVLECFGGGGDQYLGGENLLELLAFEVFRANQDKLVEDDITFSLPPECGRFPGSEALITNSQESRLNIRQLMEVLRPFWEQQAGYTTLYQTGKVKLPLFTRSGEQKLNYELSIDTGVLDQLLHQRIEQGIAGFFACMKSTFGDRLNKEITRIHIFLAGNGSRSQIVKELFEKYITENVSQMRRTVDPAIDSSFFALYPPLGFHWTEETNDPSTLLQTGRTRSAIEALSGTVEATAQSNASITDAISGTEISHSHSDIGELIQSLSENPTVSSSESEDHPDDLSDITRPNGKTGVAFGLIEGRPGGRIKLITPKSPDLATETTDIRFRYYIGYKKRNHFQIITDTSLPYYQWTLLCDASTEDFAIYYTSRSDADGDKLSIYDVYKQNCRLKQTYDNASIYYRAISPTVIEYAVISAENFDSEEYLEGICQIDLAH